MKLNKFLKYSLVGALSAVFLLSTGQIYATYLIQDDLVVEGDTEIDGDLDAAGVVRTSSGFEVGGDTVVDGLGRIAAHNSNSWVPGLSINGSRPNGVYNAIGVNGGYAFRPIQIDVTNLDGITLERAGALGIYGSGNSGGSPAESPHVNYLYLGAGDYSDYLGPTVKITPDNRVGIGLTGSNKPTVTLDVNGNARITGDTEIDGDVTMSGEVTIANIPPQGGIMMGEFGF